MHEIHTAFVEVSADTGRVGRAHGMDTFDLGPFVIGAVLFCAHADAFVGVEIDTHPPVESRARAAIRTFYRKER